MYLEPTHAAVAAWLQTTPSGRVDMLNLLRFREVADYSGHPELAPATPISGEAAYARYMAHTAPFLREAGGTLVFDGRGGLPIIGPPTERWDRVLIVRHRDARAFLSFAENSGYLAGIGHRTAALADSRLLPMS